MILIYLYIYNYIVIYIHTYIYIYIYNYIVNIRHIYICNIHIYIDIYIYIYTSNYIVNISYIYIYIYYIIHGSITPNNSSSTNRASWTHHHLTTAPGHLRVLPGPRCCLRHSEDHPRSPHAHLLLRSRWPSANPQWNSEKTYGRYTAKPASV